MRVGRHTARHADPRGAVTCHPGAVTRVYVRDLHGWALDTRWTAGKFTRCSAPAEDGRPGGAHSTPRPTARTGGPGWARVFSRKRTPHRNVAASGTKDTRAGRLVRPAP